VKPRVHLDASGDVCTVTFLSPVLSLSLLEELERVLEAVAAAARPTVLASAHPRIFLAGAHLGEIAALGPESAGRYAHRGRSVIRRLGTVPAPVVAAVHGPCLGGGLDLVLAADVIVASPAAAFGHPGARRGLVTGWGGTRTLPEAVGTARSRWAFLSGEQLPAREALAAGLVGRIAGDPVAAAREEALRLGSLHPRRTALWRTLRDGRFVDRFRSCVVHKQSMQHPPEHGERP